MFTLQLFLNQRITDNVAAIFMPFPRGSVISDTLTCWQSDFSECDEGGQTQNSFPRFAHFCDGNLDHSRFQGSVALN